MNSIPLYKQIIEDILSRIHDGSLQPGDRIPSERELAEQYLVSHITSKNALAELADKGYITRQKGKGSFVSPMEQLQMIAEFNSTVNHRTILKSKTIGLIMPSMKTSIDQQLLNCIEEELNATDYILAVTITRENQELESAAIHKLRSGGPAVSSSSRPSTRCTMRIS
ncbi:GntR family transcriptional regulator [Hungatella sp.]|uniref:GntR family transcriptional regulator n=1 Tax=Hungatella sp. TaxID=2613924 RepID=UPI002A7FE581|nr:GntR family transcriptional regulator [Hungatella sp.]